jgi:hypothetical protein
MRDLIQTGMLAEAHPSQWAPFVVVGEGSARVHLAIKQLTQPALASVKGPPAKSSRTKSPKRDNIPDWRTQIWRQ